MSDLPDADDGRDHFAPPREPCECYCLHCRRVFMSSEIWFQRIIGDPFLDGFWMCPTPNCGGAGFTFDIFPTDPNHPANEGWCDFDEDADETDEADEPEAEWDPDETKYRELDEDLCDEDDDLEGEEWKYGLEPGAQPEESDSMKQARLEWEEEQKRFDQPDERPRVLDWSNRRRDEQRTVGEDFSEDDIPF